MTKKKSIRNNSGFNSDFPEKLAAPAERALSNAKIQNLKQLTKWSEEELSQLHGMGPNALNKLKLAMTKHGLLFLKNKAQNQEITSYNNKQTGKYKRICYGLRKEIDAGLPKAESKLWHGGPVWFINGNPIVGYSIVKTGVRLLFWSGQSFEEKNLVSQGSFKASQIDYTEAKQINSKDIQRWLKKAIKIQWDYKNIVKRKGKLVKNK